MESGLTDMSIRDAEVLASGYRAQTGQPLYVPQSMYDQCASLGLDVANIEPVRPVPLHARQAIRMAIRSRETVHRRGLKDALLDSGTRV